ncbi:kynurenine--oxoglutarate transaminase 1 [Microcaecilia unicolor]|uniref:Kynurenine--oxoglutarate transaminase 1-like n=1 Tax=Microcaecilia unicolor TaxID=1415580 RepID=A0A6P7Y5A0_9AMPH|nr:kynurenine--oxoglutarate transaminase 1-like [Microcaecilia unicolor]
MLVRIGLSLNRHFLRVAAEDNSCRLFQKVEMSRHIQAQRLQGVDKNIWVEFVNLAAKYMTVNLGQGFPDFSPPPFVKEAFIHAVSGEQPMLNQYTRAFGHPPLVKILAEFYGKLLGQDLDPYCNVLVTVGAYEALFCAFQALVDEGDEVILIEPFFDCYEPMVKMAGRNSCLHTTTSGE